MTAEASALRSPGRGVAVWCGWVLVVLAAVVPAFAWLGPKGLAAIMGLTGLLTLPAIRITDEDRPALIVLFGALIWAASTTTWSPFHPKHADDSTALKFAFELIFYWSAICAARLADPELKRAALRILAWGLALLGLVLVAEAATGGAVYLRLHQLYAPIPLDRAQVNVGQCTFVVAALLPLAALGAPPKLRWWLGLAMAAGVGAAALAFGFDAPVMALVLAPLVGLAAWCWPKGTPRAMAAAAAAMFLTMPVIVWLVRRSGDYEAIQDAIPLSWSQRMGYWSHAIDWFGDKPLRGWGLDASKMFAPAIVLHPHNGALQVWLELGLIGAVAAAAFWGVTLLRLSRPVRDPVMAASAACAAVYLLFGAINFGIWQEWWMGTGALIATLAALHQPSTSPHI